MQFKPRAGTDLHQSAWVDSRLSMVPQAWRADFLRRFQKKGKGGDTLKSQNRAFADANCWLREATDPWQSIRVPLNASDDDICALADKCAAECMSLAVIGGGVPDLRVRQASYCMRWGVAPPDEGTADRPAIARMTTGLWWRRALRRVHARAMEEEAIKLGYVHRRAAIYCSNETLKRRTQQRKRNAAMMENTLAQNENGDEFTLAELAARSVANPAIRRGELMTRIAGFEAVAKGLGHVAEFVTATCPSRMHCRLSVSGAENPKYTGETPRQAQAYLSKVWARCRAAFARRGVAIYGFRIAEPHHDGCPHWHMIFFMPEELSPGRRLMPRFRALLRRYFLADSKNEVGGKANRVKFVQIDANRGSAAGYVAKYVAKNIDGYGIGSDLFGTPALEASARVEAWASTWGIRQFQQIGGPPVGVWRELRRTKWDSEKIRVQDEAVWAAADGGDWSGFVAAMGGPVMPRKDRPYGLAYAQPEAVLLTGEIVESVGRYGDAMKPRVDGVVCRLSGFVVKALRYVWRMFSSLTRWGDGANHGGSGQLSRVRPYGVVAESVAPSGGVGFGLSGLPLTPWTRVNNCTGVGNEIVRESGFFEEKRGGFVEPDKCSLPAFKRQAVDFGFVGPCF